jgi:cytochrome c2
MLLAWMMSVTGCHRAASRPADVHAGAVVMTREACGSCHRIPGIEGAEGDVGPSLAHFAKQRMIAGRLANTPANLARYLKSPQALIPGNAMPDQRLTDDDVRYIAAYLATLR